MDGRYVRSRTSSTSSLRSPSNHSGAHPATPAHTPNTCTLSRSSGGLSTTSSFAFHNVSPDQLFAGLSRVRAEQGGSRASSIPPTPAPTPNPLLQVNHHMVPEQLVAGIKKIKADEGYIDSTSFPATPAPSPFCPSPGQVQVFSPDQVAESIQRLRQEEESSVGAVGGYFGTSQPPTPSTTPGPGSVPHQHQNFLGIIPELLQESIDNLQGTDEGLASTSSPATPTQTPHSPTLSQQNESRSQVVLPEQLAAGIHRLKVEEGMSSGGSSGFPSTPAPTPFTAHPGGVRPEELAAGISRLSVIEESGESLKMASNDPQQPNLSQYFGSTSNKTKSAEDTKDEEFFDNFSNKDSSESVMQSCRESKVDLGPVVESDKNVVEAEISISAQSNDDERSLKRRQSQEQSKDQEFKPCEKGQTDIGHDIAGAKRPTSLPKGPTPPILTNTEATPLTTPSSSYATPVAPTPVAPIFNAEGLAYSTYTVNPISFNSQVPITSPLPMQISAPVIPPSSTPTNVPIVTEDSDSNMTPDELRIRDLWVPSDSVQSSLKDQSVDRSLLTSAIVHSRDELQDPVRNMVLHYRGETEAAKRNVLTANDVSQDIHGLNQLVQAGCLRSAINLTARLLTKPPFNTQHCPTSLRIWQVRIALLIKMKQFNTVEDEASAFGDLDKVDLYYEYYPESYGGRQGSMASFGFRILIAELPLHLGKPLDAMDRLYSLLSKVEQLLSKEAKGSELWKERKIRVLYALANCGIQQKDFELASTILNQIYDFESTKESKAKIRSIQGRLFLQLGDLFTAMRFFDEAADLRANENALDTLIDKSCLSIASNNYLEAYDLLKKASDKNDPIVINNMSVCLLYLGRLKEALNLLESNLTENPERFLQESYILNLATLYELESSYAGQKKQALLDLMSRFAGDGVNTACLKM